jgi:hypothetical protein
VSRTTPIGSVRDYTDERPIEEPTPPPGYQAILLAAYMVGIILLGIQLWLLTVALESYLGGEDRHAWLLALSSGIVFLGGLAVMRLLTRRTHIGPRR